MPLAFYLESIIYCILLRYPSSKWSFLEPRYRLFVDTQRGTAPTDTFSALNSMSMLVPAELWSIGLSLNDKRAKFRCSFWTRLLETEKCSSGEVRVPAKTGQQIELAQVDASYMCLVLRLARSSFDGLYAWRDSLIFERRTFLQIYVQVGSQARSWAYVAMIRDAEILPVGREPHAIC